MSAPGADSGLGDRAEARLEALIEQAERQEHPEVLDALAEALAHAPEAPAELILRGLELLEGTGRIEARPELLEVRDDWIEAIDGDDATPESLIELIEEDPDEVWVALRGLEEIESEVRSAILRELGSGPLGPGVAELLRRLLFDDEAELRAAGRCGLDAEPDLDPEADPLRVRLWAELAAEHFDPELVATARERLSNLPSPLDRRATEPRPPIEIEPDTADAAFERNPSPFPAPPFKTARRSGADVKRLGDRRILEGLVTGLDRRGRGRIVIASASNDQLAAAAFLCDVMTGLLHAEGFVAEPDQSEALREFLAPYRTITDWEVVEGAPELAVGLLLGCGTLGGSDPGAEAAVWIERVLGPEARPQPFAPAAIARPRADADPDPLERDRIAALLDACPDWIDDGPLTAEIARELALRWPNASPEPKRDAGAFRFLFEHRLCGQLELYRRMLFWMGWLWSASGAEVLARTALRIAEELQDPQYAVPSHPFIEQFATRSLRAAQGQPDAPPDVP